MRGYGWPAGEPLITRPVQLLEDIRKCHAETTIRVAEDNAQSLDLIYPNPALFTIFHELIANAIQHHGNPLKYEWHGKSSTINLSARLMTMALVSVGTCRRPTLIGGN